MYNINLKRNKLTVCVEIITHIVYTRQLGQRKSKQKYTNIVKSNFFSRSYPLVSLKINMVVLVRYSVTVLDNVSSLKYICTASHELALIAFSGD
jgi:hypothetical protein